MSVNQKFQVLDAAWRAAITSINKQGGLPANDDLVTEQFLKKKICREAAPELCATAIRDSVGIIKAVHAFQRTRMGFTAPSPIRRYELLLALAQDIEQRFPQADPFLKMAGCRLVELDWDR